MSWLDTMLRSPLLLSANLGHCTLYLLHSTGFQLGGGGQWEQAAYPWKPSSLYLAAMSFRNSSRAFLKAP